ncbi:hypothetical protein E4U54_007918 [Claviceps lovelessii]|nr:hypothetical protein E4U54_007918 [Claviceps lovelessii]
MSNSRTASIKNTQTRKSCFFKSPNEPTPPQLLHAPCPIVNGTAQHSPAAMATDDHLQLQLHIDNLLQRHLALLDQYTSLRERLSRLHSSTLQDIARANFSAQRGQRFGQDQYDGRMRALRRVVVEGEKRVRICVVRGGGEDETGEDETGVDEREEDERKEDEREEDKKAKDEKKGDDKSPEDDKKADHDEKPEDDKKAEKDKKTPNHNHKHDPLRWFGILSPPPLRSAQAHAVEAVEQVIPQLVSIATEMQHLEIEVRRARKRRDKGQGKSKSSKG